MGPRTRRRAKISLNVLTKNMIGTPYGLMELGAYDCASLIFEYLSRLGLLNKEVEQFEGINTSNYATLYKEDPQKAGETLLRFMKTKSSMKQNTTPRPGDVIAIQPKDEPLFLGISAGGKKFIAANSKYGVVVHSITTNCKIIGVFSCRQVLSNLG